MLIRSRCWLPSSVCHISIGRFGRWIGVLECDPVHDQTLEGGLKHLCGGLAAVAITLTVRRFGASEFIDCSIERFGKTWINRSDLCDWDSLHGLDDLIYQRHKSWRSFTVNCTYCKTYECWKFIQGFRKACVMPAECTCRLVFFPLLIGFGLKGIHSVSFFVVSILCGYRTQDAKQREDQRYENDCDSTADSGSQHFFKSPCAVYASKYGDAQTCPNKDPSLPLEVPALVASHFYFRRELLRLANVTESAGHWL